MTGVAAFFNPLAHGSTATAVAFLAAAQINDAGWITYTDNETSVRQAMVPSRLLGRVNSAMHLLFRGLLPVGALAGGAVDVAKVKAAEVAVEARASLVAGQDQLGEAVIA